MSGVGHLALDARMRPVAAPDESIGIGAHQRLMEGPRIGIIRRVAAEAMRARQFCPAPTLADRAQQALETWRRGARTSIGAAHVVDHDGKVERLEQRNRVGQILHIDPELQMPAELLHDWRERLRRTERHAAAIMQLSAAKEMV